MNQEERAEQALSGLHQSALWYAWGQIDPRPNEDNTVPNTLGLGTEHGQEFSRLYEAAARDFSAERRTSRPSVRDAWQEFVRSKQRLGVDAVLTIDDIDSYVRLERELRPKAQNVQVYLKGWRDTGLFARAVNDSTHPQHDEAMVVHRQSFRAYEPGDVMYHAIDFLADDGGTDDEILERTFMWFNTGDTWQHDAIARYRAAGHRSLSVGDVVVIDDRAYTCASMGWRPVENFFNNEGIN